MIPKFLILLSAFYCAFAVTPVPNGFPAVWNGDRYFQAPCDVLQKPPTWLDGYLFCQLSASYGDANGKEGENVDHMFDAISGLAVFDVAPEKSTFTGAYYPVKSYKIWNFYDRDMSQSSIAWKASFVKTNETQAKLWKDISPKSNAPPPAVDFWKIKNNIVAGTEYYPVGLTFDIDTVNHFQSYPFKEATPAMLGQPYIPIHMPIHERVDPDTKILWATVNAVNIAVKPPTLHQVIFSVDEDGVRRVEGVFDYSPFDPRKCSSTGYAYDPKIDFFPRYMHSITSTENYIVIPLTSVIFNPCILLKDPSTIQFGEMFEWNKDTSVAFLIFDKKEKKFLPVIKYEDKPLFISHQFNAYEDSEKVLVADMLGYDYYGYDSLSRKAFTQPLAPSAHAYRYTVDTEKKSVSAKSFMPEDPCNIEFPQFNHNFEGKRYKYGYALTDLYMAGNVIMKIDMDDPTGKSNKIFKPKNGQSIAFLEPYFVQKPGSKEEDGGVIVSRGYDTSVNKTRVYVLDAKTMEQVGEILAPTDTPFGFHERFYLKESFNYKKAKKGDKSEL